MNIKELFAQKDSAPELFWSLVLEPGFVQAGIWTIKDGKAEVVESGSPTPWNEEDDPIEAVDAALSSCVQKLPDDTKEPEKTVFGVTSTWVEGGGIKEEYLAKIKKICGELSLTPAGFVVLPEAIAHLFKSLEGTPVNAVIVGLREEDLEISVFKIGNLVGTTQVSRSVSISDDVIEGLSRFEGATPLPSRIIIYDGKGGELEDASNSLSKESWGESEKVKFLHPPKVEILEAEKKVLATSLAGASEMGGVSQIAQKDEEIVSDEPQEESEEDFGFVIKEESAQTQVIEPPVEKSNIEPSFQTIAHQNHTPTLPRPSFNLAEKFKGIKIPTINLPKVKFPILFVIIGVLLLGFFAYWWFYPKATVAIYVSPKSFEEELEIAFDSSEAVSTVVSGEKTKNTTGVKLIGEKAKGTVQIRNGTGSIINLASGTVLLSGGDLNYGLESSASVSAALSPGSPGTTTVQVSADSIGAEYNLAKDEIFKVGNYPRAEVDAISTDNFSGGSSREISAVSEDDREKLEEELLSELEQKAKEELSQKASSDQTFIDELVSLDSEDASFSHKVGDEADNLKLTISLGAKGIVTNKSKLADAVREKIKDKIPQGFILRDTQIEYEFEFIEEDSDGRFIFKVIAKVNFLPEINQDEIIKKISGRLPEVVESYLTSIPGFARAEIKLSPRLPGRFGTLPRVKKNISIEIASE